MDREYKLKKTYNVPGDAHYLTFSCARGLPLLAKDRTRHWLVQAVDRARRSQNMALWAYVVMPEHVHLLVWPRDERYSMERFLSACKRPVSWKAKQWLAEHGATDWLRRLSIRRAGRRVFRFWQPGGGHDRNMVKVRGLLAVLEYIHANPVRRGLAPTPQDWTWSSARFWDGSPDVPLAMDPFEA